MTVLRSIDYYNKFVNICKDNHWKVCFDHNDTNDIIDVIEIEFEKVEQCRKEYSNSLSESETMEEFRLYWEYSDHEFANNFELYVKQIVSTFYENNWYLKTERTFENDNELVSYFVEYDNVDQGDEVINYHSDVEFSDDDDSLPELLSVNSQDNESEFDDEEFHSVVRTLFVE